MVLVIDVRSELEFSDGHLQGAINFSVESTDFSAQINTLDKTADFVTYCRSGYRSRVAIEMMAAAGFTGQLINAGGIDDASATLGLPIVV